MRARQYAVIVFMFLLASFAASAAAAPQAARRTDAGPLPSIEEKTAGLKKLDGYCPLYWDERSGQLWMEVSRFGTEMLHSTGFASGLGSNDIGIDRGALSGSRIVIFERVGPKVLMVAPNLQFRAVGAGAAETRTVNDAFARSVLWGFQAAAESPGRVLVDATEFLVRDAASLAGVIADALAAGRADVGDEATLRAYARWRDEDRQRIVAFTDGLVRLFGSPLGPVRGLRSIGLLAFDAFPPAKAAMARLSVGAAGRIPRLARGVPLDGIGR